jgi:hypothetical protein
MRWLSLLLLTASLASAQQSATGIWAPVGTLGTEGVDGHLDQASDVMWCNDFVPPIGIASATSLTISAGSGDKCAVVIYDSTGTTIIANGNNVVCSGANTTFSGLSPFTLTGGTLYRVCWCFKLGSNGFYINPGGSENMADVVNAFVNHVGSAFNSCTAGVPPATTGVISPLAIPPIAVWISKE